MNWPRIAHVSLALLLVAGAGCVGGLNDGANESTDAETEWQTGVAPENRLTLSATGELVATVQLYPDVDSGELVADATYEMGARDEVAVTAFEPDGHVVVLIDGQPAWNGTVGSEDRLELSLSPDGTATVTSHSVS